MRDVAIVGSGHNALVAACYLARAGLDVEVLERDSVLGGAVSTVERWPGYAVDRGSSAHLMIRTTGIVEDLELADCGLTYIDLDPWAYAPFADGSSIGFSRDLARTCASIEAACGSREADAYAAFAADWGDRTEAVFRAFAEPPGPAAARHVWGLGRRTGLSGAELSRQFLQPGDALLDAHFTDERLKTALAWLGSQAGPPMTEPGTAPLVGWNTLLHRSPAGRAIGGSGTLTQALAERLRRLGGTVRLGDGVTSFTRRGDRVTGVRTESGETVPARAVLAGCHILTTLELLGDDALLARGRSAIRVGNGIGMVVRLGTTALPTYAATDARQAAPAMQLLAESRTQLHRAYGQFSAGETPTRPAVLAMTFSAVDPSIAPAGRHNVSLWAQWHPYALSTGERWPDIAEREADRIVAEVERLAPGFADTIENRYVQTPPDLERELGLLRGNVMHVEMGLDAMFWHRPLPELAGYRTPIPGLYLTGASMSPGGGVSGMSGRAAARVLLRDRPGLLGQVRRAVGRDG